ncbi:MAG: helicase C-terminal domain-containing protein, partial [Bacteroidota bacterium]
MNRYDGIDLPDDSCRILIFDSKPYSQNLLDLYQESCRSNSQITIMRAVRTIEQGMGRSVRGERDYSVIVVIGSDLTRLVRDKKSRNFLSSQMAKQIEIGLDIAEMARDELDPDKPLNTLEGLINQCLKRDSNWKLFYTSQMKDVEPSDANSKVLYIYAQELEAEKHYLKGEYNRSVEIIQKLINDKKIESDDKAWYLQEMARYSYTANRTESINLQVAAHKSNRLMLRPPSGVTVTKLKIVSEGRMERIIAWVKKHDDYQQLYITLSDILKNLKFGVKADNFERALNEL